MSDVFSTFSDSGLSPSDAQDIVGGANMGGDFSNIDPSAFSGGGTDLGTLASQFFGGLGSALSSGGNPVQSANSTSALQTVADPTAVAQTAIAGGQNTPQGGQGQGQGQEQGQDQGQGKNQSVPQNAIDMLKKALTGLKQQQRQNPYQIGGPNYGPDARQLNRAGRIPTGAAAPIAPVGPNPADLPADQAMNVDALYNAEGESNQAEYGPGLRPGGPDYNSEGASNDPEYGPGLRPGGPDYNSEGASNDPEYGYGQPKPEVQGPNVPYPEGDSYQPEYGPGRPTPQLPPPGGSTGRGQLVPSGGNPLAAQGGGLSELSGLASLARMLGLAGPAAGGAFLLPFMSTPAETGEMPRQTLGRKPSGPAPPYRPEDDPSFTKPGVTKAPGTGKPVQHVNPKTKKPVDPQTGDPLPTKKPHEEEGEYQPETGNARNKVWVPGQQRMTQELTGGQGIPSVLGNLARIAMPLIAMGLLGGIGGRRGGRVGKWWGHPGGFGGPNRFYGHPSYGGGMGGFLPGALMGGMLGSSMGDGSGFGSDGGNQGRALGYADSGGAAYDSGQPAAGADEAWKSSGLGSNPFLDGLVGQESGGGQNIVSRTDKDSRGLTLAQGGNPNEISQGYFQIQNYGPRGTWQTFGREAGIDLAKYPTPRSAPLAVQWKVAQLIPIGQWGGATKDILRRKGFNFNPSTPMGKVASTFGNTRFADAGPAKTKTGGSNTPNPDGNNSDLKGKEPETASAE